MPESSSKGLINQLIAPRRISKLWKQVEKGRLQPEEGIDICTELLLLLNKDSQSPGKREVYTARANFHSARHHWDQALEDHARAAELSLAVVDWENLAKSERRMRILISLKDYASLETGSQKARAWWMTELSPSNIYDIKAYREEILHQLLANFGDPDPVLRRRANQLVADTPFHISQDLVDWLISFYRGNLEGSRRYTGLRALRQIGRMLKIGPTDIVQAEMMLMTFGVFCAFVGSPCAYCGWPNTGIPVPPKGTMLPFYAQKDDHGAYSAPAICDRCGNEFYLVWDSSPE